MESYNVHNKEYALTKNFLFSHKIALIFSQGKRNFVKIHFFLYALH